MAQIRKGVPMFDFGTVQTVLKNSVGLTMPQKCSRSRAFARVHMSLIGRPRRFRLQGFSGREDPFHSLFIAPTWLLGRTSRRAREGDPLWPAGSVYVRLRVDLSA